MILVDTGADLGVVPRTLVVKMPRIVVKHISRVCMGILCYTNVQRLSLRWQA